jgi:GTP-binding protein
MVCALFLAQEKSTTRQDKRIDFRILGFFAKLVNDSTARINYLRAMEIKSAEFLISNTDITLCPQDDKHEYAFIGRSNVGKSSLINRLVGRKNLAHTSGTPGKTQLINHFTINNSWYLVDLPGYGYAKVSKSSRSKFQKMIEDYILERPNLVTLFVLIDSRHEPQKIDLEFMDWLGETGMPFSMVFTKIDKLKVNQFNNNLKIYNAKMLETWNVLPKQFATSAETGVGKAEILNYIGEVHAKL